jgi:hypothetical protein
MTTTTTAIRTNLTRDEVSNEVRMGMGIVLRCPEFRVEGRVTWADFGQVVGCSDGVQRVLRRAWDAPGAGGGGLVLLGRGVR